MFERQLKALQSHFSVIYLLN